MQGSIISGKTSYSDYYPQIQFLQGSMTTIGIESIIVNQSFNKHIKIKLYDMPHWNKRNQKIIVSSLNIDGILLLFDISSREDF